MTTNLRVGDTLPDFELPDHRHTHYARSFVQQLIESPALGVGRRARTQ